MARKAKGKAPPADAPAGTPFAVPFDDPTLVWSRSNRDCRCRIITHTTPLVRLFRQVRPGPAINLGNSRIGPSSDAEWDTSVGVQLPAPCRLKVLLPAPPPPARTFVARTRAQDGRIVARLWRRAQSSVSITVRGTYHVQPKAGTSGTLRATLQGNLNGQQLIDGSRGSGFSRVAAQLSVLPFAPPIRRIINPAAAAGGIRRANIGRRARRIGGPFLAAFGPVAATVPCCTPQPFTIVIDVEARRRGFVNVLSQVDSFDFTITAPDPPAPVELRVYDVQVATADDCPPPEPVPASGYRVRAIERASRFGLVTSAAVVGERLLLAVQPEPAAGFGDTELVQLALRSHRTLQRDTAKGDVVAFLRDGPPGAPPIALAYPGTGPSPGRPRARVVSISPRNRLETRSPMLSDPTDAAPWRDGIVVSQLDGKIVSVTSSRRRKTLVEGLDTPVVVVSPPPDSPWPADLYVAEQAAEGGADTNGRIRGLYLASCRTATILDDVSVSAMAFDVSTAGRDLVIATHNRATDAGEEIPGTGEVFRLASDGSFSSVIAGIDNPFDLALGPSGECFVVSGAGVYAIERC